MGGWCIAHEPKTERVFVRGRPWPPVVAQTSVLRPVVRQFRALSPMSAGAPAGLIPSFTAARSGDP